MPIRCRAPGARCWVPFFREGLTERLPRAPGHLTRPKRRASWRAGGKRLLEKYWGRYVAVVRAQDTADVRVLREPSGSLPCWYTEHDGISIVCSDIEDCRDLGSLTFTVNWDYITGRVAHAGLQVRDTALNEVSEIQPGERLGFRAGKVTRDMAWNPIEIAQTAPLQSPDEARELLRAATLDCIYAWASCYDSIVHNLSGGLDSSIVLSGLQSAPSRPEVTCLNYFGRGPNEDERHYAQLHMARHAGVELVECEARSPPVSSCRICIRFAAHPGRGSITTRCNTPGMNPRWPSSTALL